MPMPEIKSADDAAELLDANITRDGNWLEGFASNKLCRTSKFAEHFRTIKAAWSGAVPFEQHFMTRAVETAVKLRDEGRPKWCQGNYSRPQLDAALYGEPMRFDKAVVSILTLAVVGEELKASAPEVRHSIVVCGFRFERLDDLISTATHEFL